MVVATAMGVDLKSLRLCMSLALLLAPIAGVTAQHVVVIEGLGGEARYVEQFDAQVQSIVKAAQTQTAKEHVHVFRAGDAGRAELLDFFNRLGDTLSESDQVVLYLVGHGSYDEHEYKFNISGPDLSGEDIAGILDALPSAQQLLVNTSSASGAMAELAKSDRRLLILATRSGAERHATRFGHYFAAALADLTADVDKNRIITAEEAFNFAERQVDDYFERNGQLATEHARLEGSRADRFGLARLGAARATSDDAVLSELIAERDALNAGIDALRLEQPNLAPEVYRSQLLQSMIELAETEEAIEARQRELGIEP